LKFENISFKIKKPHKKHNYMVYMHCILHLLVI